VSNTKALRIAGSPPGQTTSCRDYVTQHMRMGQPLSITHPAPQIYRGRAKSVNTPFDDLETMFAAHRNGRVANA